MLSLLKSIVCQYSMNEFANYFEVKSKQAKTQNAAKYKQEQLFLEKKNDFSLSKFLLTRK